MTAMRGVWFSLWFEATGRHLSRLGIAATVLAALVYLMPPSIGHTWVESYKVAQIEHVRLITLNPRVFCIVERPRYNVTLPDGRQFYFSRIGTTATVFAIDLGLWLDQIGRVCLGLILCWPLGRYVQGRYRRKSFQVHGEPIIG